VCSGGEISDIAKEKKYPMAVVPGGLQPRAALPYILVAVLRLLERAGVLRASSEIINSVHILDKLSRDYSTPSRSNFAKQVAADMAGKFPIVVCSSGITSAAGSRFGCQLSENSKTLSHLSIIPEMNHNEVVGFEGITIPKEKLCVIMLRDEGEGDRIAKRMEITRGLLKNKAAWIKEVWSTGKTELSRALSLILFGDFVSVYLALMNDVDPSSIRSIDTLKRELSR
jgi:glucose/mannose-6-phosphate isomerase